MRTMKAFMFILISMILSVSVSASDIGYNDSVINTGFQEIAKLSVIATDNDVTFNGTSIESLNVLKPEKQKRSVNYPCIVQKLTKTAVMQNQNFDRV